MNLTNQLYVDKNGEFVLTTYAMLDVATQEYVVGYFYPKNKETVYTLPVKTFYDSFIWHDPYQDL